MWLLPVFYSLKWIQDSFRDKSCFSPFLFLVLIADFTGWLPSCQVVKAGPLLPLVTLSLVLWLFC